MNTAYTIHRLGTPIFAWPNHYSYYASEYWNNNDGWGHKKTATVFSVTERKTLNLPIDGEWVKIYIEQLDKGDK